MWQEVPAEEVLQSRPLLKLKLGPMRLLLHKRRVTEAMCEGEVPAPLCKEWRVASNVAGQKNARACLQRILLGDIYYHDVSL